MKKQSLLLILSLLLTTLVSLAQAQDSAVITTENGGQLTELARLGRGKPVQLAYSPDGSTIAVATSIGVWLYSADALDTETEPPYIVTANPVKAVAFSPDGQSIAFGEDGVLRLWDIAAMEEIRSVALNSGLDFITFSPDGTVIATTATDYRSVALINVADFSIKQTMEGHSASVYRAAFSPDSSRLITAGSSGDNILRIWNVADGTEVSTIEGHTNYVRDVAFGDEVIVTGSADYSVKIWDAADGSELATLKPEDVSSFYVHSVDLSPDGSTVAVGSANSIYLWDVSGSGEPTVLTSEATAGDIVDLAYSQDGTRLASVGSNETVSLWEAESASVHSAARGHTEGMPALAFSPDSQTLMVGSRDSIVWMWDTTERPELHLSLTIADPFGVSPDNTTSAAFSPDGTMAATIDGFGVKLWEPATGNLIAELEGDGLSESLAFSPDSTLLAWASSQGVFVFDVVSHEMLAHLTGHTNWVRTIAFSPDQTLLATGADDGTVRVWGLPE